MFDYVIRKRNIWTLHFIRTIIVLYINSRFQKRSIQLKLATYRYKKVNG